MRPRGGTWLPYPKRATRADMTNKDMLMEDMPKCREPDKLPKGRRELCVDALLSKMSIL